MIKLRRFAILSIILANFIANANESDAIQAFEKAKQNPQMLRTFLYKMPKGGDLHNHFDGAIYAENLLRLARHDNFCLDPKDFSVARKVECDNPLATLKDNYKLYQQTINAWSMRDFIPDSHESGAEHFFATFTKLLPIVNAHLGEVIAEIANRTAEQNNHYLELIIVPDEFESLKFARDTPANMTFMNLRAAMLKAGIGKHAITLRAKIDTIEKQMRETLRCETAKPMPGCAVTLRYHYGILRLFPLNQVFAQALTGALLMQQDNRFVALNTVGIEHHPIVLDDYSKQMGMLAYVKKAYPEVEYSLHAGELTLGLARPEDLKNHVKDALMQAGAKRIGHGADIAFENDNIKTLAYMKKNGIAVEINLTSNEHILGLKGRKHPLNYYLANHVPVVLSTDDEGILRSDLTAQYQKAVEEHGLDYRTLKQISRNGLTYSFLPGENLWQIPACQKQLQSKACEQAIQKNPKALAQLGLEARFSAFEKNIQ